MKDPKKYWRTHNQWFDDLYTKANWFDRLFRKDVYYRMSVACELCSSLRNPTVLDVGCGSGHVAYDLVQRAGASHVTGIDFSDSMLRLAQDLFRRSGVDSKADWIEGNILEHDFGNRKFDLVIALGVFDYVDDAAGLLRRMLSLSSKAVVASFPQPQFPRSNLRRWRYARRGCPVYFYSGEVLEKMLKPNRGFKLELRPAQSGYILIAERLTALDDKPTPSKAAHVI